MSRIARDSPGMEQNVRSGPCPCPGGSGPC